MKVKEVMSNDYIKVNGESPLSELLGKLKQVGRVNALIYEREEFYGILDKRLLLNSKPQIATKIKNFSMHVPLLSPEDDLTECAHYFIATNSSILPVAEKGKIVGVLPLDYVISQTRWMNMAKKKVESITHQDIVSVKPNERLGNVLNKLKNSGSDRVLLEDDFGIVGTVTISDLLDFLIKPVNNERRGNIGRMWSAQFDPTEGYAEDIPINFFSRKIDAIKIDPSATCLEAAKKILKNKINSVIVEKNGKAVYLISKLDLLNEMVKKEDVIKFTIIGLNETHIDDYEKEYIHNLCKKNSEKVSRTMANVYDIIIHIKEYKKSNSSKGKYSVHVKIIAPTKIIATDHSSDWDLARAIHKAFSDIMHRIEHKINKNYDIFVA